MKKKQLTLNDIRNAIIEYGMPCKELGDDVQRMSDEAFAKCEFAEDLGIDSIDITEITIILERDFGFDVSYEAADTVARVNTVQSMLDEYNKCLS